MYGHASRQGCGGGAEWVYSVEVNHCGHMAMRQFGTAGSTFFQHSREYRTTQTFAHELGHLFGTGHDDLDSYILDGHDSQCPSPNQFESWNLMRAGTAVTACSHRHFWASAATEPEIQRGAEIHATFYP